MSPHRGIAGVLGVGVDIVEIDRVARALERWGDRFSSRVFTEGEPAIVVTEDAAVREGPDPRAARRADAREGERAYVVDRDGEWVRVQLPEGRAGWMSDGDVGD